MPTIELTQPELWGVLSAVINEIENTERFIADVDPARVDAKRAARDLAILRATKKKLELPHAND